MGSISQDEFRKLLSTLRREKSGLSNSDISDLKKIASGHFDREKTSSFLSPSGKSINKKEAEDLIKYLRENPSQHHLSKSQVNKTEEELKEDLND